MTPEEEREYLMEKWLGILSELWTAIGKPIDQDRLKVYRRQLSRVPMGLLEKAIIRVLRENTYSNVPPVGTVWQAVRRELGDPFDIDAALDNW